MENILKNNSHGFIAQLHSIHMQPSTVSTTPLDIQQIFGKDNLLADALSRTFDDHVSLSTISMPIPNWLQSVQQGYVNDSSLSTIIQRFSNNPYVVQHYSWDGSYLRYESHLVLS